MALATQFSLEETYHNAVLLQNRQNERERLVSELRSQIRIVVDNSMFW